MSTIPYAPAAEAAPKYFAVADQLAARIRAGDWADGRIPAVRDLADQFGVSPFTASKAIQVLRDRGLVTTRDRAGCFVARPDPVAAPHWGVVLRVSPGPWKDASQEASKVGFDAVAAEDEVPFVTVGFDIGSGRQPADVIEELLAGGAKGLILLPSRVSDEAQREDEDLVAGCRRAGLPVVLVDRNLRGADRPLEYDLVASDHFDGGRVCTRHLLDLGRKAVACVVASPTSSHADRLAGYLAALNAARDSGEGDFPPLVLRPPVEADPKDALGWLADEVIARQADGVVCYQDYTAVGLMMELLRRGANVPRDVAVVGCDDLPIGNSFPLGVTTYAYPSAAIARWAVRVLANRAAYPADPPAKVLLPGRLIVRASTVG